MISIMVQNIKKVTFGEIKLGEAKKLQNVFKSNLSQISRRRYKSEEQKSASKNIELLYES